MTNITPFLWFDTQAEDAMNFYLSVFPDSEALRVSRYGEEGPFPSGTVLVAEFRIGNTTFRALNAGPWFKFNEAVSFQIDCETQEEVDHLWEKLTADGGQPGDCGWLKDKFGLSWQVTPKILGKLLADEDGEKADRVMKAMMQMTKLDIPLLLKAAEG